MSEAKSNTSNELTNGSILARNTALNLLGQFAPLVAAIFAIPLLIRGLGIDRFGVLTLAWVVIGYFSLFDLGLSRALTKLVAEKLGADLEEEIPDLVRIALLVMFLLGVSGAIAVILLLPWVVRDVLNIPKVLQTETLKTFYLLALSVPVVITSTGLRGILEAYQRFDLTNAVRIPLGIYSFLAPLFVLPFSQNLFPVVLILVAGRLIGCMVHLRLCFYVVPALRRGTVLQRGMVGTLISFGSWITVSNVVSPLMVYLDRFLIGGLISVAAVAYYATPYEVVTKLLLIPGALVGVLFPAFSKSFVQDRRRAILLFGRGVKYVFLALLPITLIIITLADEGLRFWLGGEFAQNSTRVLQWLAVGVFINSLAQVPFALIQGSGRPDLTAKLHLIELPFYLVGLWWMIGAKGIEGVAIAWVARIAVDTILLFYMAQRLLLTGVRTMRRELLTMGLALLSIVLATLPTGLAMKMFLLLLMFLTYALSTWFLILAPEERALIGNRFKKIQLKN